MKTQRLIQNQHGMTLVEIMIVLALIVGIFTTVGTTVSQQFQKSKVNNAKIRIGELSSALERYNLDCNRYPTTEQGLEALVSAPSTCANWGPAYTKKNLLKDPWDNDFIYELVSPSEFEIISLGADGQEGGEGLNADISNLDNAESEE